MGFAELVKSPDYVYTYRLTPLSLWNAAASGLTVEEVIGHLEKWSKYEVPQNIPVWIQETMGRYGRLRLTRDEVSLVLEAETALLLTEIRHLKELIPLLGEALDDTHSRVDPGLRGELKQALIKAGHPVDDLAGYTDGEALDIHLRQESLEGVPLALREYQVNAVDAFHGDGRIRGGSGSAFKRVSAAWDRAIRPWTVAGDGTTPQPSGGLETRVGEAVLSVLQREGGDGLAGVVVLTDGASNAGTDPGAARQLAVRRKIRLFAVGVGSLELPDNVQLVNVQAPSDVHVGDAYGFSVFVKGQGGGVLGKDVVIELLRKPESGEGDPDEKVDSKTVQLPLDAGPVEVKFDLTPDTPGRFEFLVRAVTPAGITELSSDDNQRRRMINVTDRKLKVLLLAGGPTRDYRFVRNMLYRHPGIEIDVLLQTADPGDAISQDADRVLQQFPEAREELFAYDVIVGFDPDWQAIPDTRRELLTEWIDKQAGGLLVVAGDVFTPELADISAPLDDIRTLYPVILEPLPLETNLTRRADRAWPVEFSEDGLDAAFLHLSDDAADPMEAWGEFEGVFRCFPTTDAKDGALVYAHFSDPSSDHPVLMASQFYGSGRVLYVGSPELWRLRALEEDLFDRFWIKAIRELGQARLKRGTNRGTLLLDRSEYLLGQTITLRAHLLDPQFQDLTLETTSIELIGPDGRPLGLTELRAQPNRPGQYVGSFRASLPGTYRLAVPIPPEEEERLSGRIDVVLPDLESIDPRQNRPLLASLVQGTGGEYLELSDADGLPSSLPNQGIELLVDKGRPSPLWDRVWVLYLLVGLLCLEWITRKLLKLA